jgi:hypothetical protein
MSFAGGHLQTSCMKKTPKTSVAWRPRTQMHYAALTLIKLTDKCEDRVKSLVGVRWQRKN